MQNFAYFTGKRGVTAALLVVFALAPFGAYAQTTDISVLVAQLQAQITALQIQVQALQAGQPSATPVPASLPTLFPTPVSSVVCPNITRSLYLGISGSDVSDLQQFLRSLGYFTYPTNTGYFGPATEQAVQDFQKAEGIVSSGDSETTGFGVVGKQTREAIAKVCSGGGGGGGGGVGATSGLRVLSPNGGETWTKGTTQTISWKDNTPIPMCPAADCASPKYYDIQLVPYYSPCTGNVCPALYPAPYTIAKNIQGSSYNWSVGKYLDVLGTGTGGIAPDGSYTIQVCQTGSLTCESIAS